MGRKRNLKYHEKLFFNFDEDASPNDRMQGLLSKLVAIPAEKAKEIIEGGETLRNNQDEATPDPDSLE